MRSQKNWIITVVNAFDLDVGGRAFLAGVVTCPLTERTFQSCLVWRGKAADDYFAIRGYGQTGDLFRYHLHRFSQDRPGEQVLCAGGELCGGRNKKGRVVPHRNGHRASLAQGMPLFLVKPPVLARRYVKTGRFVIVDHIPVSAKINHAGIRVPGYHRVGRAHIPAPIQLVPPRRRKLHEVNVCALMNIFQQAPGPDGLRRESVQASTPFH